MHRKHQHLPHAGERLNNHHLSLQVNLTWLDLSFNSITFMEGLDKLVNLTDLSLFANKIEVVQSLQTLTNLNVLSLGESLATFLVRSSS